MEKNWKRYIIFLIMAVLFLVAASSIERYIKTLQNNMIIVGNSFFAWEFIVYFIAGTVFGFEKLFCEIKKEGRWKINVPRLLILGMPSLLIGTGLFLFLPDYISFIWLNTILYSWFMQMLFGYVVVTSFYK